MIQSYLQALFFIFAAEMGDKTQILAMMFATRYKTSKVLIGIAIGAFLNHGLAVLLGQLLGTVIPTYILQLIAGAAFIGFALWTLKEDDDDAIEETKKGKSYGAVFTVALAFFVGELGDKTQLTAITLAMDTRYPFLVLLGTVSGMIVTSSIGIFVGSKIGDKIPEAWIKLISSSVFLTFGVLKLVTATPANLVNGLTVSLLVCVVGLTLFLLFRSYMTAKKAGKLSLYRKTAQSLYDYTHQMRMSLDELCRGSAYCGECQGTKCAIGFMRYIVKGLSDDVDFTDDKILRENIQYYQDKFARDKLLQTWLVTMDYVIKGNVEEKQINGIRNVLEMLLWNQTMHWNGDGKRYYLNIKKVDEEAAKLFHLLANLS